MIPNRNNNDTERMKRDARSIFQAGLDAVEPRQRLKGLCRVNQGRFQAGDFSRDLGDFRNIHVIGAGKASAAMGAAIEDILGDRVSGGLIVVKYGYTMPLTRIRLIEAGHPLPDENGCRGAAEIMELAATAAADDLVICLISGGGSALLPLPVEGITLEDKQQTMRVLLSCGASISEINTIRKHLSAIKGGRLARAVYPATLLCLVISDVIGDDLSTIASGPTVPDPGTFEDCLAIFKKYDIAERLPPSVTKHIRDGRQEPAGNSAGDSAGNSAVETPKPDDPVFQSVFNLICAGNLDAIRAARSRALELGYHTLILSSRIEGETKEVAGVHAAIARECLASGNPLQPPACILSGGETTVTIQGQGRGGRNQEFCLAAVAGIAGTEHIVILSGGTDGTDGPTDAAGAVIDCHTQAKAEQLGLDPGRYLDDNDAYSFFEKTGGLLMTGPTNTNVMDLRIMLIA
ncbi:MAG: glycerate kinase [Desulfosudaceae bacterium]